MPYYCCNLCNISTKLKYDFNRHLNTKKHADNIAENNYFVINETMTQKDPKKTQKDPKRPKKTHKNLEKNHECDYCNSKFTTFAHKRRHEIHRCKMKNPKEQHDIKLLKEEKKILYKQISKLIDKAGNNTTTTTNNITNNQQNNINLNSYGKEDLSHITDAFKLNLLKKPFGMIPKMIEAVHFNPGKPENKNISFPNKKENMIKIFRGNQWIYKDKEDVINELLDGKYLILDCHYEEVEQDMNKYHYNNYQKFKTDFDDGDKKLFEILKKECELVLLNNR
jgi:hypothetical protein